MQQWLQLGVEPPKPRPPKTWDIVPEEDELLSGFLRQAMESGTDFNWDEYRKAKEKRNL